MKAYLLSHSPIFKWSSKSTTSCCVLIRLRTCSSTVPSDRSSTTWMVERLAYPIPNDVPAFLPMVPVDYMDGKPVKYRPGANHTFILYSVGERLAGRRRRYHLAP